MSYNSMKQQIVFIHGGETFATYEDYFKYLADVEIDFSRLFAKRWHQQLQEVLGEGYEVIAPRMPNVWNAKYMEWKIYFEKHLPFIRDGVVLIGHSLGGIFLAKYLAEENFPVKIKATFLVAPPYDDKDSGYSLADFVLPKSLKKLEEQGGKISLYHSEDDPVVPFADFAKYSKALPTATARNFKDREHFTGAEFYEIVADIKKL